MTLIDHNSDSLKIFNGKNFLFERIEGLYSTVFIALIYSQYCIGNPQKIMGH
jgi:hypothetical protein